MSVIYKQEKSVNLIEGTITDPNESPIPDAYAEVFDTNGRVAGCRVGANGRFCFHNIKKGIYVLRLSQTGFDTVTVNVKVQMKRKNDGPILVSLSPALNCPQLVHTPP